MQPRFVFAASVLFSVELANWIQIWEAPALPQFSHWLCTCSSSKYSDSFQRNFKADCYNQVEITSTNSRWTSWPKLETGGQSFLFSKYFHSSRWEYWIHETILQFRRILSLTINSINYVRYEKRVGEAELAEGRLAKAEPDPGGTVRHIGVLPPVILGLLFKLRTNPDFMYIVIQLCRGLIWSEPARRRTRRRDERRELDKSTASRW